MGSKAKDDGTAESGTRKGERAKNKNLEFKLRLIVKKQVFCATT